ncbi:acyl-CoA dehydrogenase family protein [Pseudonocardia pini]|uniref:acyl-CoA dehydrogenase family protein n=1 Tax=Pseudonocardia pini TaxID=2758030 RepID=UPI0015F0CA2E|nr:acyl-CoA dehydrogenase family protein [Pseudonocardia pini]
MRRSLYDTEHEDFRAAFRAFVRAEITPHLAEWEAAGIVPRELFAAAGEAGFVGMAVPAEYGGGGVPDFRFSAVVAEEIGAGGISGAGLGLATHNDICLPYVLALATAEQRERWLPGLASGELVAAIAMTEPGTGSDLTGIRTSARREGGAYVVDGAKTFITNGINADLVITVVRTDRSSRHGGLSLLVLERGMPGFTRGRNLDKLGQHAQDTAELAFDGVRVPEVNLLGEEGGAFVQLVANLPQERLSIAVLAVAAARAALDQTLGYVKQRKAFGRPIGSFQNSRFVLAEIATEVAVAQSFVDDCVRAHVRGELSAEEAAQAKWWCTELQGRVVDRCLQLHGGYGYMLEYPIAKAYADARITRIYGGTTEIMKEVVGRGLGL